MTETEFKQWVSDPSAVRCVLVEVGVFTGGAETVRYLSNLGYVTGASDTPANVAYEACVVGGVTVSESLPLTGRATVGWGDIEVSNQDGSRDHWLDDIWSGRPIKILVGDLRWPRSEFRPVFSGVVQDISPRNADTLNILLRDKGQQLNTPMSEATLANATLTSETIKPLCFGEVHNITPVLIDPGTLTYMVHDGPVEDIFEVRDNGVPVDYGKNLGAGTFALTASPVGAITASVQGAKPGGVYLSTVGPIVRHIGMTYGKTPLAADEVDEVQLAAFGAAHTQHVGVFLQSRANQLDTMQQLAASVGAQVVFSADGQLQLKKVEIPVSAEINFAPSDMLLQTLAVSSTPALQPSIRLAYCKNYTVQQGLTTGLPAAHTELYAKEWLVVQVAEQATADLWKLSTAPEDVQTLLQVRLETEAEAVRRLALWGVRRLVLKFDSFGEVVTYALGAPCNVTHHRFGLSAGKLGQIIGKKTDWLSQKVSFEVLV